MDSIHNINDREEIKLSAPLISTYADNAVELIAQAFSGSAEVSFLPLYYALQNLAKVYVVLAGKRTQLLNKKNQLHGVTRKKRMSRKLFTEELILMESGTIPLFYQVLTGDAWKLAGNSIKLGDIYPFVNGITFEYERIYKQNPGFQQINIEAEQSANRWQLTAQVSDNVKRLPINRYQVLKQFKKHPTDESKFISINTFQTEEQAIERMPTEIRRCLLVSDYAVDYIMPTLTPPRTPLSSSPLLMPQEIPILLAFFHLSTIVRYYPEFMRQIKDSNAWGMLLNLKTDTTYNFLLAFWSNLHQANYVLKTA